jgi:uncharacterized membrane protein YgdD (TMEM256/DUF423 family)
MSVGAIFQVLGGLAGAAGVALSAAAAHAGGANTATAATMLLAHAPALLAVGLANAGRATNIAAAVLTLGVMLFCGDLLIREFADQRFFPMAAPAGGLLMIAGWLGLAITAIWRR